MLFGALAISYFFLRAVSAHPLPFRDYRCVRHFGASVESSRSNRNMLFSPSPQCVFLRATTSILAFCFLYGLMLGELAFRPW